MLSATEQVEKLTVAQKKAYTQALRAQQASDEHAGFIEQPRVPAPASSRDDIESEEEYCDSPPNTESSVCYRYTTSQHCANHYAYSFQALQLTHLSKPRFAEAALLCIVLCPPKIVVLTALRW